MFDILLLGGGVLRYNSNGDWGGGGLDFGLGILRWHFLSKMTLIQRKKRHLLVKIWVVGLFGGMDLAYRTIFGCEDLSSFAHP